MDEIWGSGHWQASKVMKITPFIVIIQLVRGLIHSDLALDLTNPIVREGSALTGAELIHA